MFNNADKQEETEVTKLSQNSLSLSYKVYCDYV